MEEVFYRTSFVLCSLPMVAVLIEPLDIHLRFSRPGLALVTVVWLVLLHRIGRGGTPAGASGREVALLRPGPTRLVTLLLIDNLSRGVLCIVVGVVAFGVDWPFALALYIATRLVGFRTFAAMSAVALLGATAVLATGPARIAAIVAAVVLASAFALTVVIDRFSLRALASGTDGADARVMVQFGDWHGLVARLIALPWLPTWLVWVVLGAGTVGASRLLHAPARLVVPIVAFVAAHVSCRLLYEAFSQPDRLHLVLRGAGSRARIVAMSYAVSLPFAGVAVAAAVLPGDGPTLPAAVAVVWALVLAEAVQGGPDMNMWLNRFDASVTIQVMVAIRSFAVAVGIGIAYVPPGPWSASVAALAVAAAVTALGVSTVMAAHARA